MQLLPIYEANSGDFSTNGLALLQPTACRIEGRGNDLYELTMELPLTDESHWEKVVCGRIIKAQCPVRENPEADVSGTGTTRLVWRVEVNTHLRLRQEPSTRAKILGSYENGTEVLQLAGTENGWMYVSVLSDGATGYMDVDYLQYARTIDVGESIIKPAISRHQLFRIYQVEVNTRDAMLSASAQHIFYDLRGCVINRALSAKNMDAVMAAQACFGDLMPASAFRLRCGEISAKVTGEYGYKSPVEALLGGEEGIIRQAGAMLIRDNWDVYMLPNAGRDTGATIRRGKNLEGVTVTTDYSGLVTRIIPCGRTEDGEELFLNEPKYVDSEHINDYPVIYCKRIDYDIKVGDDDYPTAAAARAALSQAAADEFAAGCDVPVYGMEIDMVTPEGVPEALKPLQAVHLFDTVTVIDEVIGLKAKLTVTQYVWDVMSEMYESIVLGDITDMSDFRYWGGGTSSQGGELVQRPAQPMTDYTSQGCTASASSEGSSLDKAWHAFNGDADTPWHSTWAQEDATPWIELDMDVRLYDISVTVYSINTYVTDLIVNPVSGWVEGSNDGATWVRIGAFDNWRAYAIAGEPVGAVNCGNQSSYSRVRVWFDGRTQPAREVGVGYMYITGRIRNG